MPISAGTNLFTLAAIAALAIVIWSLRLEVLMVHITMSCPWNAAVSSSKLYPVRTTSTSGAKVDFEVGLVSAETAKCWGYLRR